MIDVMHGRSIAADEQLLPVIGYSLIAVPTSTR